MMEIDGGTLTDENLCQSNFSDSMTSLILPKKRTERVLIEELPDTKTDTPKNDSESDCNFRQSAENAGASTENSRRSSANIRCFYTDSILCTEHLLSSTKSHALPTDNERLCTEDSRVSLDNFFQVSSDSGISIDTEQKLAQKVGSAVLEQDQSDERKVKSGHDLDDID